jgi:hypothetical protein
MPPVTCGPQQWAMIGLITGAEIFGILPRSAAGRVAEFMNGDPGDWIPIGQATTEDVEDGRGVSDVSLVVRHIAYVQPWATAELPVNIDLVAPRGRTALELSLTLRTRVNVTGTIYLPPGVDLDGILGRIDEKFLSFTRAVITAPDGQSRSADRILVSRDHMMIARRVHPTR